MLRGGEIFRFSLRQSPAIELLKEGVVCKIQPPVSTTQSLELSPREKQKISPPRSIRLTTDKECVV